MSCRFVDFMGYSGSKPSRSYEDPVVGIHSRQVVYEASNVYPFERACMYSGRLCNTGDRESYARTERQTHQGQHLIQKPEDSVSVRAGLPIDRPDKQESIAFFKGESGRCRVQGMSQDLNTADPVPSENLALEFRDGCDDVGGSGQADLFLNDSLAFFLCYDLTGNFPAPELAQTEQGLCVVHNRDTFEPIRMVSDECAQMSHVVWSTDEDRVEVLVPFFEEGFKLTRRSAWHHLHILGDVPVDFLPDLL